MLAGGERLVYAWGACYEDRKTFHDPALLCPASGRLAFPLCHRTGLCASCRARHADRRRGPAKAHSSPTLYGLMTEEINFSYDGGLYGELRRNRAPQPAWDGAAHWSLVERGDARAALSVDGANGPSTALPSSLKLQATAASAESPAEVENEGYWGIALRLHTSHRASFYARASAANATVTVALLDDATGRPVAQAGVTGIGTEWQQYSATLTTGGIQPGSRNHFVLSVARPGTFWVTLASLFPPTYRDRLNGNRIDLMEKLAAMHPAFLRLPGGNYLRATTLRSATSGSRPSARL